ncbi:MAG: universal stress protein [Mycolicibacterium mageritense]|nr:MAG: universal stress protein [Mycolicibacterium mageritense]
MMPNVSAPIVVCIDGSDAAITAAEWAAKEAASRDVALRLVHVAPPTDPANPGGTANMDRQYAESALHAAATAVAASEPPVKIETEILCGAVDSALIDESRHAAMVCLGSVGIGQIARAVLGSTAAEMTQHAQCPVAIIRSPRPTPRGTEWILVAVDPQGDNDAVVECALQEARLREVPVLAVAGRHKSASTPHDELDRQVARWRQRFPDVHIYPVTTPQSIEAFLAEHRDESIQLAVVGPVDAATVAEIVGPHRHPLSAHGNCSVLVVR